MRLVLWDIDGTLVETGGGGRDAFGDAFARVVGRPVGDLATMAGRTDQEIALETLARNGVEDAEALWPQFEEALANALSARADELRADGRALPGAREAIAALARADGVVQSLLTGNVRPNAQTKLDAFGLLDGGEIDLEVGAYGSDDRHRPALVAIARERAGARYRGGAALAPEKTVLIGDTPRDVEAALAGGTRVVGVATGRFSATELEDAGAPVALADLCDTDAVVAAVLATTELAAA